MSKMLLLLLLSFNPRAREGRDLVSLRHYASPCEFQSTRPRGARLGRRFAAYLIEEEFQSTRPRGARRAACSICPHGWTFQSTRPRGARRASPPERGRRRSFNPRAREGRDRKRFRHREFSMVSIHAPARGATGARKGKVKMTEVSIHAPARGATPRSRHSVGEPHKFQSTRPRGARQSAQAWIDEQESFQSTRPRGARRVIDGKNPVMTEFQSTRPRGARRISE